VGSAWHILQGPCPSAWDHHAARNHTSHAQTLTLASPWFSPYRGATGPWTLRVTAVARPAISTPHAAGAPSESGVTSGYVAYLHITSVGLIARAQPGVEGRHVHRTRTRRRTRWAASRGSEQVDHLIVPITSGSSTTATFLFEPAIPSVDVDEMLPLRGARL
jgi:hypothetical protein